MCIRKQCVLGLSSGRRGLGTRLDTTANSLSASLDVPEVFLFVCPQNEVEEMDKAFSNFLALNSVSYTSKFSLDTPLAELGTFESVLAHFFLVLFVLLLSLA